MNNTSHIPTHASLAGKKAPQCMICSIEESVLQHVCKGNSNGHKYAKCTKHLTSCSVSNCKTSAHTVCPPQSKLDFFPAFMHMSCFERAHNSTCDGLFLEVMQGDHTYYKTNITHPVAVQLGNFAKKQPQRLSARSNQGTLPAR
eukprot:15353592-Ditylum_brightwellii.AAC.2